MSTGSRRITALLTLSTPNVVTENLAKLRQEGLFHSKYDNSHFKVRHECGKFKVRHGYGKFKVRHECGKFKVRHEYGKFKVRHECGKYKRMQLKRVFNSWSSYYYS
jgi:hypothetical protein